MALGGVPARKSDDDESSAIFAEINITPLTDIFLVLLVIFMVTTSVMNQAGVDVNLPKASQATAEAQPEGVIITLLPGGEMKVNSQKIAARDFGGLESALKTAFEMTTSRVVILEGDRQAYLGSAIEIMDVAKRLGADKFAIAADTSSGN